MREYRPGPGGWVWLTTVPVLVIGGLLGHAAALRVEPDPGARARWLTEAGHGWVWLVPSLVGACTIAALLGFVGRGYVRYRHGRCAGLPSWWLAALPALTFVVQEHVERLAEGATFAHPTLLESAVLVGLAIQLPCGLLGIALVRLLLKLSDRACDRLRSRPRPARPQLSARWACIAFEPIVCTGRRGAIGLRAPPGMTTRR